MGKSCACWLLASCCNAKKRDFSRGKLGHALKMGYWSARRHMVQTCLRSVAKGGNNPPPPKCLEIEKRQRGNLLSANFFGKIFAEKSKRVQPLAHHEIQVWHEPTKGGLWGLSPSPEVFGTKKGETLSSFVWKVKGDLWSSPFLRNSFCAWVAPFNVLETNVNTF